jgi:L-methionine (R)-S-oxide reductase
VSEETLDLCRQPKDRAYAQLHAHLLNVLGGVDDDISAMATMSALIHHAFRFLWTGFYRVAGPGVLHVGPYQGTVGCLDIAFGRGVCGTAAAELRTIVVPDVDKFSGHISCDPRAKSEIVVPVLNAQGTLIAVLDIDSEKIGTFDQEDANGLGRIVKWFAGEGRG